jgi:hypothetical protein
VIVARLCCACGRDLEVDDPLVRHADPECPAFHAAIEGTRDAYWRNVVSMLGGKSTTPTPLDLFIEASPKVAALLRRGAELAARHVADGGAS